MGLLARSRRKRDLELIRTSDLFDADWYLQRNADVAQSCVDPLQHYYDFGAAEGTGSQSSVRTYWYTQQNADVVSLGLNPLVHYLQKVLNENAIRVHYSTLPGICENIQRPARKVKILSLIISGSRPGILTASPDDSLIFVAKKERML